MVCLTPFPRASLAIESPEGNKQGIICQISFDSPIPTTRVFNPLYKFLTPLAVRPEELPAARLISGQLLGERRVTFDLPNLQLGSQQ